MNIIGPHGSGINETTSRPADSASGSSADSWFRACTDGDPSTGTKIPNVWLNKVTALLRRAIRGTGTPESELDDDMLLNAIRNSFPAGTMLVFAQAAAPAGWSKVVTADNAALRLVSGASGGTVTNGSDFTIVFASRTPDGTVQSHVLSTDEMPPHDHFSVVVGNVGNAGPTLTAANGISQSGRTPGDGAPSQYTLLGAGGTPTIGMTSSTGSGTAHAHGFLGAALDFAVRYVDVIVCRKN